MARQVGRVLEPRRTAQESISTPQSAYHPTLINGKLADSRTSKVDDRPGPEHEYCTTHKIVDSWMHKPINIWCPAKDRQRRKDTKTVQCYPRICI